MKLLIPTGLIMLQIFLLPAAGAGVPQEYFLAGGDFQGDARTGLCHVAAGSEEKREDQGENSRQGEEEPDCE